jgi:homoserine O-acetyltransferase
MGAAGGLGGVSSGLEDSGSIVAGIPVREGVLAVEGPVQLHHGGRLPGLRIAWRLTGPANAPVVCALGGISAHRRVCLTENPRDGWWSEVAGRGLPLDASRWRILGLDFLGGSGESTGPASGVGPAGTESVAAGAFPSISTYDQAQALLRVMDVLGISALHAFCAASYGGMVALAFAQLYPQRVRQLLIIGAADRTQPMATAWRSTQREMVRFGLEAGDPARGLDLARRLAMTTYRSAEEFAARFDAPPKLVEGRFVFPVEEYLGARGRNYAAGYNPDSFLCLSESIDLHCVDAGLIPVPTTAVAVREDRLVPPADIRAMVARLPQGRMLEFSSIFGHDAFLKEPDQLRGMFASVLENVA